MMRNEAWFCWAMLRSFLMLLSQLFWLPLFKFFFSKLLTMFFFVCPPVFFSSCSLTSDSCTIVFLSFDSQVEPVLKKLFCSNKPLLVSPTWFSKQQNKMHPSRNFSVHLSCDFSCFFYLLVLLRCMQTDIR